MKRIAFIINMLCLIITMRAQTVNIYKSNGNVTRHNYSEVNYLDFSNDYNIHLKSGSTISYSKSAVNYINFTWPTITVTTYDATDITETSTILNGSVSANNTTVSYTAGFFLSTTNSTPSINSYTKKVTYSSSNPSGNFSASANNLSADTKYYCRAYVLCDGTYYYGAVKIFTTATPPASIIVSTKDATNIKETSATLNGSVSATNTTNSYTAGFFLSTLNNNPSSDNYMMKLTYGISNPKGSYSVPLSVLSSNTKYYYCAYVYYDDKYYYGTPNSFKTILESNIWRSADYDISNANISEISDGIYGAGTADGPDTNFPLTIKSSTITSTIDGVTMTGVSTPNSLSQKDVDEGKVQVYWELKGSVDGNDALITEDCSPQFAQYLMPQGNPGFNHWEFYETNSEGDKIFRAYDTYWSPGTTAMPVKGAYYKFAASKDVSLRVGIYGKKNLAPTYVVDELTLQPIPNSSINVSIYYQINGFPYEGSVEEGTAKYFNVGKMPDDYVLQHVNGVTQNRPVLGFIDFDIPAGKTYWLFNPMNQIGIYGFYVDSGSGIANVNIAQEADSPQYNLTGQKVSENYSGLIIQNNCIFEQKK